jgi:DNA-binding transcriptional ArsR family regulator
MDVTEQGRLEVSDPQMMRAMAHPARLSIMDYFLSGETGTATELAEVVGLSPSATSYHLRALAKYGLVEEAPSRGDARERVWQTRLRSGVTIEGGPDQSPEVRAAARELADAYLVHEEARARRWLLHSESEAPEWVDAAAFSHGILMLTADELTELTGTVHELLRRYSRARRPDPPPGSRVVSALFRAYPMDESIGLRAEQAAEQATG